MCREYHFFETSASTIAYMSAERSENGSSGFGPWLKSQILSRQMTQNEFAKAVGVSPTSVSRWIAGDQPKGGYIDYIADVLRLPYDLVATKAGYRPAIEEVPPDSREARAAHLVTRIDWDKDAAGYLLTMLEHAAVDLPKGK